MTHTGILLSLVALLVTTRVPLAASTGSTSATKPPTTRPADGPMIIAHRGLHHTLPENSKEAMLAAWKSGTEWCECDVYLSSDGVAVMMHDAKLDRTTEAKGPVTAKTWKELKAIRLKNPDGTLSKCRIPSLQEVMAAMPKGCGMLVELKPADDEQLVREVLKICKNRKAVLQSFDAANVRHSLRLGKGVPAALLVGKPEHLEAAYAGDWHEINVDFKLLDDAFLKRMKAAGKSPGVWTVDDPEKIRQAIELGAERIITNFPERVKAAIVEARKDTKPATRPAN